MLSKYFVTITTITLCTLTLFVSTTVADCHYEPDIKHSFMFGIFKTKKSKAETANLLHAKKYIQSRGVEPTDDLIVVDVAKQTLELYKNNQLKSSYYVSTSSRGIGQVTGTRKTPAGLHKIADKVGANAPRYAIFKHREFTGQVWPKNTPRHKHRKDYIVTRILHLEGLESGVNSGRHKGVSVDSKERGIYIHGTTMEWKLGSPASIGCIHMSSKDVTTLFNQVPAGTLVWIKA